MQTLLTYTNIWRNECLQVNSIGYYFSIFNNMLDKPKQKLGLKDADSR